MNIVILDTSRSGEVTKHTMNPRTDTITSVVVQCTGDHYNGIIIKDIEVNHTISDCPVTEPLPHPWSFDPLPAVTPLLLPQFLIDTPKTDLFVCL